MKIHYRPYNPADLDRITELDRLCFEPTFRFSRAAMRRFAEAPNAETIIAETADGELAGFIITHREPIETPEPAEAGYLLTIDVAPAFRRRGVAKKLLTRAENWVRGFHGAALLLHVYLKNEPALRFYESMKYQRAGIQRGFYGPRLDAALYWKDLRESK